MTRPSGSHLSADEIDAWLAGALAPALQRHVDQCQVCLEQLRVEREIADQIAALPLLGPMPGFSTNARILSYQGCSMKFDARLRTPNHAACPP